MGIPSYFSYIIRNYKNIIRTLGYFTDDRIDHLFMDCNSIIYDAVRMIPMEKGENKKQYESALIQRVIHNIEIYIAKISPNKSVFITFDGVAPFAKMNQQRTRRHKTEYLSTYFGENEPTTAWNTSAITPGTEFMNTLSSTIMKHFQHYSSRNGSLAIQVSGSNECGEGEHKLFRELRIHDFDDDTVAVYGLDADLFMLSIFHIHCCKNIYVFREAPEFMKNSIPVDPGADTNAPFFVDISSLVASILTEMNCKYASADRIYDYAFLCFFLGNDFLPHFPAMNIRTHGIQALLDIYRNHIGFLPTRYLISPESGNIQWKNVGIFLREIAKREHEFLRKEYFVREKFDRYAIKETTQKEKDELLQNAPIFLRGAEEYICPKEPGWEGRYYKSLLGFPRDATHIKQISMNYLEGIEWVYKYYTQDCPDWKWKYNYSYPPLFMDLVQYVPHFETEFIQVKEPHPFSPITQMAYVFPLQRLDLLPPAIGKFLKENYAAFYPSTYTFEWAFCRYFWESHPILPEIPLNMLENLDIQFRTHALSMK